MIHDASAVAILFSVDSEVCCYLFEVRAVLAGRDLLFMIHETITWLQGLNDEICWTLIVRTGNEERPSPELVAVLCVIC